MLKEKKTLRNVIYNRPKQKLVYSKDTSKTFGIDSLLSAKTMYGKFASTSHLACSIRSATANSNRRHQNLKNKEISNLNHQKTTTNFFPPIQKKKTINYDEEEKLKNKTITNWKTGIVKSETPKNLMDIKIRNIVHDYTNVDINDYTYDILSNLKSKKRMMNLDYIEFYEIWKKKYLANIENEVKKKVEFLKNDLENTKNEIYSKFLLKNDELIPLTQKEIDSIVDFYNNVLQIRENKITDCIKEVNSTFNICHNTANLKIIKLIDDLDKIGFLLQEQVTNTLNDKKNYIQRFTDVKKSYFSRVLNEIHDSEKNLVKTSQKDCDDFVLRWKNIKLNNYVSKLQNLLKSKEYSDCEERAQIVKKLKNAQEKFYLKKHDLIFNILLNLEYEQITAKTMDKISKNFENINTESDQEINDIIKELMENSKYIQEKSLTAFEIFKGEVSTINYDFTKDNHNEKKYNDYDDLTSIDELIEKEIFSVLNKNETDRKNYMNELTKYLDDYDEYINNICEKLLNFFSHVGKIYDEHKKDLKNSEKSYLISYAKECDNDDNIIHDKETELNKILEIMNSSINKTELDTSLTDSFKIVDDLEIEFREFFKKIDEIFSSHDNIITTEYHKYEQKVFNLFGLYSENNRYEIEVRREKESDFLTKKKEAQIAEEERIREEEEAKEEERTGKKKPQSKKKPAPQLKKGEIPPKLVPPREILNFKSKLGFEYLKDFTIEEYVKHILRNIINKRDDDIFELKPKTPEELELLQKAKEEYELKKKEEEENKNKKNKKDIVTTKVIIPTTNNNNEEEIESIDYLNAFDPYNANHEISFHSPLNNDKEKLLSEENAFLCENITKILNELFNKINEKINSNHLSNLNDAHLKDQETREEQLSELDIRLKSLLPRKGKIEVEEYDKRLNELSKHEKKFEKHIQDINNKNKISDDDNNILINKIQKDFNDLKELHEKLSKSIEEQDSDKLLEDQYKKFKTTCYDFLIDLEENEIKLKQYTDESPAELLHSNSNFLASLKLKKNGGTYSEREVEHIKSEIEKLENEVIKVSQENRQKENNEKLKGIRDECEVFMKNINDLYSVTKENIMAKDAVGKKFGVPKRLANDIIINIKIKCNQAKEGLELLFNDLINFVNSYKKIKNKDELNKFLLKNDLPLNIRKQLQKINTCVWNYGKYISAFKENLLNNYQLIRVIMKENTEDYTITEKEDLDADELLKKDEILCLGFLSKAILDSTTVIQDKKKVGIEQNYNYEISTIDDKIKTECAKIYVGNYAKYLNADKLPDSLVTFLEDVKREMEIMRLHCVKDLRTFCQNLYKFSLEIPECVCKYIYEYSNMTNVNKKNDIMNKFNKSKENCDKIKEELKTKLGPYLANPFYSKDLNTFEVKDNERNQIFLKTINETQFDLIVTEESSSKDFTVRLLNNFICLMTLFDNFIFEEEFITLGDEEYFKKQQNYNELLKLKDSLEEKLNAGDANKKNVKGNVDISKYDLESKRTFKKLFKGLNLTESKINYYDLFNKLVKDYVENSEDKIKVLENEYRGKNYSKSISGIKLQNNKNLFQSRNYFYKKHTDNFNACIKEYIDNFNNLRLQEIEYKFKWDEMIKDLKATLKRFNIPEGVTCETENEPKKDEKKDGRTGSRKKTRIKTKKK